MTQMIITIDSSALLAGSEAGERQEIVGLLAAVAQDLGSSQALDGKIYERNGRLVGQYLFTPGDLGI